MATRFDTRQPLEKTNPFLDSVFGNYTKVGTEKDTEVNTEVEKTPVQKAEEERNGVLQDIYNKGRERIERQRTDDAKMAGYNALGNLLTAIVQPIGWAIGGHGSGVTGGVIPYDNRQYIESFNRAVKASDDLRNLESAQDQYRLKTAEEKVAEAKVEEARQKEIEDYERKRKLDAEYGVNRSKSGEALYEERKSQAINAWTIHNNGMSLSQYIQSINAAYPGYFGENWTPNQEELDRIEAEVRKNASRRRGNGGGNNDDREEFTK